MAADKKPADKKTSKKASGKATEKKATSNSKKSPYGEGSLQVMGQPRKFPTDKDFQSCFIAYIEHCATKQLLPNIAGFTVYADITKDTFYQQQRYYPDSYRKIRQALEDALIQHNRFGQSNPAMAIVQGKNTFKWDDTGKGGGSDAIIDVDFDADSDEIDNLMSKLGYLPSPEF